MKDACWGNSDDEAVRIPQPQPRPWGLIRRDRSESPALIETVARLWNIRLQSCAETAPAPDQLAALVILNAPRKLRSVTDQLITQALERDLPILAIGSGARLLAQILGAAAHPTRSSDHTRTPVLAPMFLSDEGCVDRALGAAPSPANVVHRHHEPFDLPDSAVAPASSPASPAPAFRRGRAYGVPFHLELDTDLATRWGIAPVPEATLRAGMAVLGMFARLSLRAP